MIRLQAFLDDSGSDGQSPVFVLAGYLANVGQWTRFSRAWDAKCKQDPHIDYFKMSQAMGRHEQFERIPEKLRDQKVFELAEIAHDHIEARIEVTMKRQDFNTIVLPACTSPEFRDPYFTCFYALVMAVNSFHRRLGLDDVGLDFIFDDQGNIGKTAVGWWDILKAVVAPSRSKLLGSAPMFKSDIIFKPLQAADMYAWIIRDRLMPEAQRDVPKAVLRMLADKYPIRKHLDADYLRGLAARLVLGNARAVGAL